MLNKILRRRGWLALSMAIGCVFLCWSGYELLHLPPAAQMHEKNYTFIEFQDYIQKLESDKKL